MSYSQGRINIDRPETELFFLWGGGVLGVWIMLEVFSHLVEKKKYICFMFFAKKDNM